MADTNSTTLIDPALPLAHRANTDAPGHWDARLDALNALRDARIALGEPAALAADYAISFLDAELEAEAAQLAAQAEAKRAGAVGRAKAKAEYHLAGGLDIRTARCGAYLVPSGTRSTVIHVVSSDGSSCSCESTGHCWHLEAVAQVKAEQPAPLTFDAGRVLSRVRSARAA